MLGTSGNRAVDMLITYRVLRILTTPFEKQDAFKYGIIDKTGKVYLCNNPFDSNH